MKNIINNSEIKKILLDFNQEVLSLAFLTKRSHSIKRKFFFLEKPANKEIWIRKILAIFIWILIFSSLVLASYYLVNFVIQIIIKALEQSLVILDFVWTIIEITLTFFNVFFILFLLKKKFSNKKYRANFLIEFQQSSNILSEKIMLTYTTIDLMSNEEIEMRIKEIVVMMKVFVHESRINLPLLSKNKWLFGILLPTNNKQEISHILHIKKINHLIKVAEKNN